MKISMRYPNTIPTTPRITPIVAICFVEIIPVEAARAFGGVETGRHIAKDAQIAIPAIIAGMPPKDSKAGFPDIALPTTTRIGTTRFAAAEFEMKFERK